MEQFSADERDAMYSNMFALFNSIYPVSQALQEVIRQNAGVVFFRKRSVILEHGKICRYCYFGVKGLVRAYYVKDSGHEVTSWFMKEGDIIISVQSFFRQEASHEVLEAMEDTVCIALRQDQLEQIYRVYPEFNYIGRKLTEEYYIQMENRAFSLRMDNATQRYQKLLQQHPDIITRVPLTHIASYLGISPSTLSRIRGKDL
jgi:CRP-like cAMP-binding protein